MLTYHFSDQCDNSPSSRAYDTIFAQFDDNYDIEHSEVRFDCRHIKFIKPFGMNLLSSMLYLHLMKGNRVLVRKPESSSVYDYMADQGFFDEFNITSGEVSHIPRSTSARLKRLHEMELAYLDNITAWLAGNMAISPITAGDLVKINLIELINNVLDHSESEIGCYISAQAYPGNSILMLSILDLGVGFYRSLKPLYPEINDDSDAIEWAIREGVSSKRDRETRPRGLGLNNISGFLLGRGSLEIASYTGYFNQMQDGQIKKSFIRTTLRGVCINIYLDVDAIIEEETEDVDLWGD